MIREGVDMRCARLVAKHSVMRAPGDLRPTSSRQPDPGPDGGEQTVACATLRGCLDLRTSMRLPSHITLPLIIACALFMENLDGTIIATSLPVIAHDLAENPIALKLALTSYLVSLAVFIPISGWMADRHGSRTVFRMAIAVFVIGSIACGLSSSLSGFVASRFVQGMGGAMMVPVGRIVLLKSVEKRDLVKVLSYLTIPALIGPIIGPPLGGFISTYFDWRWIFFINVPIGLLGWTLAGRYVPEIVEDERTPLDWLGFVLSGFGLSAVTLGAATFGGHLLSPVASPRTVRSP